MSQVNTLGFFYLAHLSLPLKDRVLYQAARKHRVRRVLEIGLEDGTRLKRMLSVLAGHAAPGDVVYSVIDLFESRPSTSQPAFSLKEIHQLLTAAGVRSRLVPGDPHAALARAANAIGPVDLIVLSSQADSAAMASAWFYMPRLLHEGTLVFQEQGSGFLARMESLSHAEIAKRATQAEGVRRAA